MEWTPASEESVLVTAETLSLGDLLGSPATDFQPSRSWGKSKKQE
jgi:hypothetical protein